MTTFTDKELIKEIKERISSMDVRDNVERRAYEIALASLEEDPVAWLHSDNGLGIPAITRSKNIADSWLSKGWYVQPLYIAKPVPVVPDARPSLNNGIVGFDEGWNASMVPYLQARLTSCHKRSLNRLLTSTKCNLMTVALVPFTLMRKRLCNGFRRATETGFRNTLSWNDCRTHCLATLR